LFSIEEVEMDPVNDKKPTSEQAYLDQLSPFERVVIEVAKRQLGMSFDLKRSIGFLEFISKSNSKK